MLARVASSLQQGAPFRRCVGGGLLLDGVKAPVGEGVLASGPCVVGESLEHAAR